MWVKLLSSIVDKNIGYYILNYIVSNDISSLTVKVGGTEQSFEKDGDIIEIKIPINSSKGVATQVLVGSELLFNIYGVSDITLENNQVINSDEYKSLDVKTAVEIIDININILHENYIDNSKILEINSYNSNSKIVSNEEYTRGLNDGLVLGQML